MVRVLSAKKFETSPRGIRFLEFIQQDEGVIIKRGLRLPFAFDNQKDKDVRGSLLKT